MATQEQLATTKSELLNLQLEQEEASQASSAADSGKKRGGLFALPKKK